MALVSGLAARCSLLSAEFRQPMCPNGVAQIENCLLPAESFDAVDRISQRLLCADMP